MNKSFKKKASDWIGYAFLRVIAVFVAALPDVVVERWGSGIGTFIFHVSKKHRKIALHSIQICFGKEWSDEKVRQVALRGFQNMGKNLLLFLKLPRVKSKELLKKVRFVNEEYLKEGLAKGKGVILVSAHMGNWEYAGAAISARAYPVVGVAQRISNPWVDSYVSSVRQQRGIELVVRSRAATADFVRVLSENKILILVTDQNAAQRGVSAKFFGVETSTFVGWITLARRTGAAVVPAFCAYENGELCIFFEKPLDISVEENSEKTYKVNAERVNGIIERYIRRFPEQWFWLHNRWRVKV